MKPKSVANVVCEPMVNVENRSVSDVSAFTPFVFKIQEQSSHSSLKVCYLFQMKLKREWMFWSVELS